MAARATGRRWRAGFALGSLALHAALLGVAAREREPVTRVVAPAAAVTAEMEIDVTPDALPAVPEPPGPAAEAVAGETTPRARAGRPASALRTPEHGEESFPSGDSEPPSSEPAPAPAVSSDPPLSLTQLGVAGPNPFLDRGDPAAARAAKAARTQQRLDRALAQGLIGADAERGHGSGGPVLRALQSAVYASNAPLNGNASFVFVIDGAGTLLSTTLGDATGDRAAWLHAARQAAKALAGKTQPVRKGRAVKLTVAVSSHLELPSGADPGLEISAQGVPLKKGAGPRSTRLDLSIFPFPAATLAGDPADVGARPRRMVHAHVVSEELL